MGLLRRIPPKRRWLLPAFALLSGAVVVIALLLATPPGSPDPVATQVYQLLINTRIAELVTPTPPPPTPTPLPTATATPAPTVTPEAAQFNTGGEQVALGAGLRLDARAEQADSSQLNVRVTLVLPVLTASGDAAETTAARFNQDARRFVETQVTSILSWLNETPLPGEGGEVLVRYKLVYASPALISLEIVADTRLGGAPGIKRSSLNYDLAAGRQLELPDLFAHGADYLAVISRSAMTELEAREPEAVRQHADNLLPKAENYLVWGFTGGGLRFTFDEYRLTPLPISITVPYRALAEVAQPDGALRAWLP
jgi:hypothetical protein